MVLPAVQGRDRAQVVDLSVYPDPDEASLAYVFQHIAELALPASHQRRQHLDPALLRPAQHCVGYLRRALPGDRSSVIGTVRNSNSGPEESQVVVDLRHGADGRTRILSGGLLLDGDCRRKPFDRVYIRLFHEPQELPRVGRQRLDVPPLSLGIDGVEGKRRFPRA